MKYYKIIISVLLFFFAFLLIYFMNSKTMIFGSKFCDGPAFFYYSVNFIKDCFCSGELPLWNPYIFLGYPFHGEGQGAIFYPFSLLFAFLNPLISINLFIFIHIVLTSIFFFYFLKTLKICSTAAFLSALVLSFSSLIISRIYAGHLNMIAQFPWVFAILLFWNKYKSEKKFINILYISLSYSLLILCMYPTFLYVITIFLSCYILFDIFYDLILNGVNKINIKEFLKILSFLCTSIILSIGISMISLLPAFDFINDSFRDTKNYNFCSMFSFAPENLFSLLCPTFFGTRIERDMNSFLIPYWGRNYLWEMMIYIGIVPLIASFQGMRSAPKKIKYIYILLLILFLIIALGNNTPFFYLLYNYMPFFNLFRGSSKYIVPILIFLVILSSYGFDYWLNHVKNRSFILKICLLIFFFILSVWFTFNHSYNSQFGLWYKFIGWIQHQNEIFLNPMDIKNTEVLEYLWKNAEKSIFRSLLFVLSLLMILLPYFNTRIKKFYLLILLILLDLIPFCYCFCETYNPFNYLYPKQFIDIINHESYPARVVDFIYPSNLSIKYHYSNIGGYAGNTLKRYNDFYNISQKYPLSNSSAVSDYKFYNPLFNYISVQFVICDQLTAQKNNFIILAEDEDTVLAHNMNAIPRTFLSRNPCFVSSKEEARKYFFNSKNNLQIFPVIESKAAEFSKTPIMPSESVSVINFTQNSITLAVNACEESILVLNEMYHKDWKAKVNNKETHIFPANYVFRSLKVPKGKSTVQFYFLPESYKMGKIITLLSIFIWICFFIYIKFKQKNNNV